MPRDHWKARPSASVSFGACAEFVSRPVSASTAPTSTRSTSWSFPTIPGRAGRDRPQCGSWPSSTQFTSRRCRSQPGAAARLWTDYDLDTAAQGHGALVASAASLRFLKPGVRPRRARCGSPPSPRPATGSTPTPTKRAATQPSVSAWSSNVWSLYLCGRPDHHRAAHPVLHRRAGTRRANCSRARWGQGCKQPTEFKTFAKGAAT